MAKEVNLKSANEDPDEIAAELGRLVSLAVEQIREPVRELEANDRIISRHSEYPKLGHFDSGQPKVTHSQGPIDYSHIFQLGEVDRWYASFDEVPAFKELADFALGDERLRARLLLPGVAEMNEVRERMLLIGAAQVPLEIFDRLMNTIGPEFSKEDLEAAWIPMRNGLLWTKLPLELVVPVCLTGFEAQGPVELDGETRLEPLADDEQRARVPKTIFFGAANDCVVAAATHAVCLSGCEFEGNQRMVAHYGSPDFYPLERIEQVFEALRMATSAPVGHAQIFMRPLGWAWDYEADLAPIIQGSIARRYPPDFDDYGWLREPQVVSEEELSDASLALGQLKSASKRRRLASRRLSSAALRHEEDDAVLDLCIALEAALGDRQRSEMTYKLSMRSAAVLSLEEGASAEQSEVLRQVKALYNWRSAIVHGDDVGKTKQKFVGERDEADALEIAASLLRDLLMTLVRHPELGDGEQIDTSILLEGTSYEAEKERPAPGSGPVPRPDRGA